MDYQCCCSDAFDFYAEFFKVETKVLDHVIWTSVANRRDAVVQCGRHDDVLGHGVSAFR